MTTERLAELVSKVQHGYNLINSEAREVLEHFGVAMEQRKRCKMCGGVGLFKLNSSSSVVYLCVSCNGTGYEERQ